MEELGEHQIIGVPIFDPYPCGGYNQWGIPEMDGLYDDDWKLAVVLARKRIHFNPDFPSKNRHPAILHGYAHDPGNPHISP